MLHLRERQDERQLLGGNDRVLQDQEETRKRSVLAILDDDDVDIKNQEDFFKMSSAESS